MHRVLRALCFAALAASAVSTACNGDGGGDDATPAASATRTRATSTAAPARAEGTATPASAGDPATPGTAAPTSQPSAPTAPPGGGSAPPPTAPPPAPVGRVWTLAEAQALLNTAPITTADLSGAWTVLSDTSQSDVSSAGTALLGVASLQRCGWLAGRTLANLSAPEEIVTRYLGGQAVSFFTNMTVYATEAGAADCAAEAAINFTQNTSLLVQAFGTVFVDPSAVVVSGTPWPPIGDGSIAFTLKGKTDANGTIVDLTILVVAFRRGNVAAVVGSAAAQTPSSTELSPHVNTVLARIAAAQ